jgi:hypothetical protein
MPTWVNRYGLNPLGAHSIRGQMFLLFHDTLPGLIPSMTILLNVVVVIVLFRCWKGEWNTQSESFDFKFALLIIVGLLVAPHVNFHDLSFLLLPGLVVFYHTGRDGVFEDNRMRSTLFVVGFPLQVLTFLVVAILPIQINVIGLLMLGGAVAKRLVAENTFRPDRLRLISSRSVTGSSEQESHD